MSDISEKSPWPTELTSRTMGWTARLRTSTSSCTSSRRTQNPGLGHPVGPGHHHRPHHVGGQRPAVGGGLVGHGLEREVPELPGRDPVAVERAKTGVERVDGLAAGEHGLDHVPGKAHATQRLPGDPQARPPARHGNDVMDDEGLPGQLDGASDSQNSAYLLLVLHPLAGPAVDKLQRLGEDGDALTDRLEICPLLGAVAPAAA